MACEKTIYKNQALLINITTHYMVVYGYIWIWEETVIHDGLSMWNNFKLVSIYLNLFSNFVKFIFGEFGHE